eukprot:gb/GECG01016062.1/.p1 GENE.gb/GECG01016062.1/~~gb/GECG01016062.1/.p1  ORF type:complete len:313 (+),score=25.78 gb/GECG01016062.1/:1-939(+)
MPRLPAHSSGLTVLLVMALGLITRADANGCSRDFGNASFNLGELRNNQGWVLVDNRANFHNQGNVNNYTYHFNFCENMHGFHERHRHCGNSPAPAFQVARFDVHAEYECQRLGGDVSGGGNMTWELADNADPSRGIILRYENGEKCGNQNSWRSFAISILCDESAGPLGSLSKTTVIETEECHYDVFVPNRAGCPTSCPQINDEVCGGNGVCRFNTDKKLPQCYCFPGFSASDCQKTESSGGGISTAGVILILLSLLTAACLVFLYLLWKKVSSLRLDMNAYRSLADDDALGRRTGYDQARVTEPSEGKAEA